MREKQTNKDQRSRDWLLQSEIHKGRVFDLSASAEESKHDTACQTKKKKRKPKQMRQKKRDEKRKKKKKQL